MKLTGIAALFAAMTTVTAAPLVNADVAGAKLGLRDAEIQAGANGVHIDAKREGDILSGLGLSEVLGKRGADLTNVASNLTPELKKLNILPGSIGVEQVTKTLDVLNVKGLLGNVTPLLNNLVGGLVGGLLGGVLGGQGGGSQITQLAGNLLPEVTGLLPGVGPEQLGSLLSLLQQNGALKDLTGVLGGM